MGSNDFSVSGINDCCMVRGIVKRSVAFPVFECKHIDLLGTQSN
jgi:hypothetical protein